MLNVSYCVSNIAFSLILYKVPLENTTENSAADELSRNMRHQQGVVFPWNVCKNEVGDDTVTHVSAWKLLEITKTKLKTKN